MGMMETTEKMSQELLPTCHQPILRLPLLPTYRLSTAVHCYVDNSCLPLL